MIRTLTTATKTARRLIGHELRLFISLGRWAARRPHGISGTSGTSGGTPFGYAKGQSAMMLGLAFVCVIETFGMSVLLRDYPLAHTIVLVLDVYTVFIVVGLHAASVTRPHVLDDASLRIRRAVHVDLRVPLRQIASVRRELRASQDAREGELELAVGAQTTVTVELTAPLPHFTFLGRRKEVRLVRFHADDADALVTAVRAGMERLRQERTGPSPSPGLPV